MENKIISEHIVPVSYDKEIRLVQGDILQEEADLLICSVFQGKYNPYEGTLVGGLHADGIDVKALAKDRCKRFDLDDENGILRCWVSKKLSHPKFKRLGCLELLDISDSSEVNKDEKVKMEQRADIDFLTTVFARFSEMIQNLAQKNIPISRIAMTVPGTGNQGMEMAFVAPLLISVCNQILQDNPAVQEIVIYEKDNKKVKTLESILEYGGGDSSKPVFISYSSKDSDIAQIIYDKLEERGIHCWKAPEDIPSGSNYQKEIPAGLQETYILLVVLTENSENSRWCHKEIGCAIGAGHIVLPVKFEKYDSSDQFNFLMDGEQIFPAYEYGTDKKGRKAALDKLYKILRRKMQQHNASSR